MASRPSRFIIESAQLQSNNSQLSTVPYSTNNNNTNTMNFHNSNTSESSFVVVESSCDDSESGRGHSSVSSDSSSDEEIIVVRSSANSHHSHTAKNSRSSLNRSSVDINGNPVNQTVRFVSQAPLQSQLSPQPQLQKAAATGPSVNNSQAQQSDRLKALALERQRQQQIAMAERRKQAQIIAARKRRQKAAQQQDDCCWFVFLICLIFLLMSIAFNLLDTNGDYFGLLNGFNNHGTSSSANGGAVAGSKPLPQLTGPNGDNENTNDTWNQQRGAAANGANITMENINSEVTNPNLKPTIPTNPNDRQFLEKTGRLPNTVLNNNLNDKNENKSSSTVDKNDPLIVSTNTMIDPKASPLAKAQAGDDFAILIIANIVDDSKSDDSGSESGSSSNSGPSKLTRPKAASNKTRSLKFTTFDQLLAQPIDTLARNVVSGDVKAMSVNEAILIISEAGRVLFEKVEERQSKSKVNLASSDDPNQILLNLNSRYIITSTGKKVSLAELIDALVTMVSTELLAEYKKDDGKQRFIAAIYRHPQFKKIIKQELTEEEMNKVQEKVKRQFFKWDMKSYRDEYGIGRERNIRPIASYDDMYFKGFEVLGNKKDDENTTNKYQSPLYDQYSLLTDNERAIFNKFKEILLLRNTHHAIRYDFYDDSDSDDDFNSTNKKRKSDSISSSTEWQDDGSELHRQLQNMIAESKTMCKKEPNVKLLPKLVAMMRRKDAYQELKEDLDAEEKALSATSEGDNKDIKVQKLNSKKMFIEDIRQKYIKKEVMQYDTLLTLLINEYIDKEITNHLRNSSFNRRSQSSEYKGSKDSKYFQSILLLLKSGAVMDLTEVEVAISQAAEYDGDINSLGLLARPLEELTRYEKVRDEITALEAKLEMDLNSKNKNIRNKLSKVEKTKIQKQIDDLKVKKGNTGLYDKLPGAPLIQLIKRAKDLMVRLEMPLPQLSYKMKWEQGNAVNSLPQPQSQVTVVEEPVATAASEANEVTEIPNNVETETQSQQQQSFLQLEARLFKGWGKSKTPKTDDKKKKAVTVKETAKESPKEDDAPVALTPPPSKTIPLVKTETESPKSEDFSKESNINVNDSDHVNVVLTSAFNTKLINPTPLVTKKQIQTALNEIFNNDGTTVSTVSRFPNFINAPNVYTLEDIKHAGNRLADYKHMIWVPENKELNDYYNSEEYKQDQKIAREEMMMSSRKPKKMKGSWMTWEAAKDVDGYLRRRNRKMEDRVLKRLDKDPKYLAKQDLKNELKQELKENMYKTRGYLARKQDLDVDSSNLEFPTLAGLLRKRFEDISYLIDWENVHAKYASDGLKYQYPWRGDNRKLREAAYERQLRWGNTNCLVYEETKKPGFPFSLGSKGSTKVVKYVDDSLNQFTVAQAVYLLEFLMEKVQITNFNAAGHVASALVGQNFVAPLKWNNSKLQLQYMEYVNPGSTKNTGRKIKLTKGNKNLKSKGNKGNGKSSSFLQLSLMSESNSTETAAANDDSQVFDSVNETSSVNDNKDNSSDSEKTTNGNESTNTNSNSESDAVQNKNAKTTDPTPEQANNSSNLKVDVMMFYLSYTSTWNWSFSSSYSYLPRTCGFSYKNDNDREYKQEASITNRVAKLSKLAKALSLSFDRTSGMWKIGDTELLKNVVKSFNDYEEQLIERRVSSSNGGGKNNGKGGKKGQKKTSSPVWRVLRIILIILLIVVIILIVLAVIGRKLGWFNNVTFAPGFLKSN